ncbi:MAG: bifunctional methylenetetrahydrofolate dehydrogenase/methenyltetrahydrofolate cyclohydrolase FolD [Flavobacteriales bacterium]|nr:bifunctional methylenetetrahydrofolate dehydrogenase/methenyltetrahydrofolate cyclohydrolase FolD [Flavobacteriales bacterium]|tara:strand:+ start:784 stop:1665 length:882 start_codon:yes stop_codon:yes gene_type:complete
MIILDGKKTSNDIKEEITNQVKSINSSLGKTPHLSAILVGNDGASETYINAKVKACEKVGFASTLVRLPDNVSEEELLSEVDKINNNQDIDGLIVQLPLPSHIDEMKVTEAIDPKKDVDGFHPSNIGRMALNLATYLPATPAGILELLKRYNVETSGKHCVVIGRSHIVGSPMSVLMARNSDPGNCTVTLTHSRTQNLKDITRTADILIVALGKAEFVTSDMIKEGVCIIDVGITRVKSEKTKSGWQLLGDVNFEDVKEKCSYITPVPGGVGPMTIAMLLQNTLLASKKEFFS